MFMPHFDRSASPVVWWAVAWRWRAAGAVSLLWAVLLLVLPVPSVLAQETTSPPAGTAAASKPATLTSSRDLSRYPRPPVPFYRGNGIGLTGWYFNLLGLGVVVGVFFLWVWSTRWAEEDCKALNLGANWAPLIIGVGVLGFVAVFAIPTLVGGLIALVLMYGGPIGWYVYTRNQYVPANSRVMTPAHLQKVAIRLLSRLGLKIGPSKKAVEVALGPPIRFIGRSSTARGGDDPGVSKSVENSKGFLAAKELVYDAIKRRATDVHLEPKLDELAVRLRIDGVMYPGEPFDRGMGDSLVNIFKVLSGMDITERRRSQDGSFRAEMDNGKQIDFRAACQGTREGEKMSLRILDQSNSVKSLTDLGMRKPMFEGIKEIIHQPHGLFLSCGPTGAGKSTTLYAALSDLDAEASNIITVEDPIEYKMAKVTQIEINTKAGQTFASALRSILRQDPDVVLIGEIRDEETAKIACQAANTGHMVFSTVHANDTFSALYRLQDLGIEPFLLSTSLSGILGQRLVRKLCTNCREEYKPPPELLKQLALPAEKVPVLWRPPKKKKECDNCHGLGYRGRMGVFELLVVTERMRDMIRDKASATDLKAEARKNGMLYMREEGLRLLVKGLTSLEELKENVK